MAFPAAVHGIRRLKKRSRRTASARAPRLGRSWHAFGRAPTAVKIISSVLVAVVLTVTVNWIYQVLRKPSELLFPVSGTQFKTPAETWRQYAPSFNQYSTKVMTPELLAAIAQVEGSGNPLVRTYWRWSWKLHPFEIYRPASSAVGMYQITDGNFAEARHYCIREHTVVEDEHWGGRRSCWFNRLYSRVVPADAVELTSAYLDRSVTTVLARHGMVSATLRHRQELAALIHLCGAGTGDGYVRRGFRLSVAQRCGDHEVRAYLARVNAMKGVFERIAGRGPSIRMRHSDALDDNSVADVRESLGI